MDAEVLEYVDALAGADEHDRLAEQSNVERLLADVLSARNRMPVRSKRREVAVAYGTYATASTITDAPGTCRGAGTPVIDTHGGSEGTASFRAA